MIPTEPGYYWAIRANSNDQVAERIVVPVRRKGRGESTFLDVEIGNYSYPLDYYRFLSGPLVPPPLTPEGPETGPMPEPTRDDDHVRQLFALIERTEAIIARSEALADRAQGMEGDSGTAGDLAARVRNLETSRQAFRAVNENFHKRMEHLEGWAKGFASLDKRLAAVEESREAQDDANAKICDRIEYMETLYGTLGDQLGAVVFVGDIDRRFDIRDAAIADIRERLAAVEEFRKVQEDTNGIVFDRLGDMLRRIEDLEKVDRGPDMSGGALGERIDELARRLATQEEVDASILRTLDRLEGRTKYLQGWAETIRIMEERLKQLIEHMREFGRWSDAAEDTRK